MSLDIGHLTFLAPSGPAAAPAPAAPAARAAEARPEPAEIPPAPPAGVRDEVEAAARRAAELAAANRELHFHVDDRTGRLRIQVRDMDGRVIRDIPPSTVLEILSGAA